MSVAVSQVCSKSEGKAFQDTIRASTHTVVPRRENFILVYSISFYVFHTCC